MLSAQSFARERNKIEENRLRSAAIKISIKHVCVRVQIGAAQYCNLDVFSRVMQMIFLGVGVIDRSGRRTFPLGDKNNSRDKQAKVDTLMKPNLVFAIHLGQSRQVATAPSGIPLICDLRAVVY
jgi:hypothetical protein